MPPLSVEKERILKYLSAALGEEGRRDVDLPVSCPPFTHELPRYFSIVESVELHLGIHCDRSGLKSAKQVTVDLYLPGRDLYIELDREEHDMAAARGTTLLYYPPGLPRGFHVDAYRQLVGRLPEPPGSTRMYAIRALADFVKDLYVEGELGKPLVRLPKHELAWLLDKRPHESKLEHLKVYLGRKASELNLAALRPE